MLLYFLYLAYLFLCKRLQIEFQFQYSGVLNKVFIMSNSKFVVEFKWASPNEKIDFFVRAMPLYSSPQDAHKPVLRCVQHQLLSEASNAGKFKLILFLRVFFLVIDFIICYIFFVQALQRYKLCIFCAACMIQQFIQEELIVISVLLCH